MTSKQSKCPNCKGYGDVMNWLTGKWDRCSKCGGSGETSNQDQDQT